MKAVPLALFVALAVIGCAQPKPQPPPKPPQYSERVILLPNRDGRASAVIVKRASGEQELASPYQGIELAGGKDQPVAYSEQEVRKRYGELLQAQPARPVTYVLNFNLRSTELTPQSKPLLNEIRQRVKAFPAAQITVIGHADRVGSDQANDALSLKRAMAVREMLIQTGVARAAIDAVGRGEREPLVGTADGRPEERNRRVEIKLR